MNEAAIHNYMKFFTKIEEKPGSVKNWVDQHLVKQEKKIDTELAKAFFEGEAQLIRIYLKQADNTYKILPLVREFHEVGSNAINKIELKLLANILQIDKESIASNPIAQRHLIDAFNIFKEYAETTTEDKEEVQQVWNWSQDTLAKILGDITVAETT